jgi:hypothetical protein
MADISSRTRFNLEIISLGAYFASLIWAIVAFSNPMLYGWMNGDGTPTLAQVQLRLPALTLLLLAILSTLILRVLSKTDHKQLRYAMLFVGVGFAVIMLMKSVFVPGGF